MGRKPDPKRKAELLESVGRYLVDNGLAGLSLRPLAEHLGVSTYTLVYHFGSKENLVFETVRHLDAKQWSMIAEWTEQGLDLAGTLERFWDWFVEPQNRGIVGLFHEATLVRLGADESGTTYAAELVVGWDRLVRRALAESGLDEAESATEAAIVCATMTGLQIDLIVTGDIERTTAAVRAYTARLRDRLSGVGAG